MKVTVEDLERLDIVCEHIEKAFDKDGQFRLDTIVSSLVLSQDLLWLSTFLFNLLEEAVDKHKKSLMRTSMLLSRINIKLNMDRFK